MKLLNFFIQNNFYILLLFATCTGLALCIAYIAQYFFHIIPCKLCMYSRIPFLLITFTPIIFLIPGLNKYHHYGLIFILICLIASVGLSFYHLGVESHWFKPALCKLNFQEHNYHSYMYDFLLGDEQSLSQCDIVKFKLFGIFSFAALNLIYSVGLFLLANYFLFAIFFKKMFNK